MAKSERKAKPARGERSPSGPTKATTFRISPSGIADVRRLSATLDLRSQALAIETAVHTILAAFAKLDVRPPITAGQMALTGVAIRSAGVSTRTLGATANYVSVALASVMAAEGELVPTQCTTEQFVELVTAVKGIDPVAALWLIGKAIQE